MIRFIVIISIPLFFLMACKEEKQKQQIHIPDWTKEQSTNLNKRLSEEEDIKIRLFLKQKSNWEVEETGSGLRIWVYERHDGEKAKEGDRVDVKYKMSLLDGTVLYETEDKEISSFKVDKTDIETGVMEGVKHLAVGDKAKLIVPSHIGHGLLGDFNKIPPLEVLLIDLELVKIY